MPFPLGDQRLSFATFCYFMLTSPLLSLGFPPVFFSVVVAVPAGYLRPFLLAFNYSFHCSLSFPHLFFQLASKFGVK